MPISPDDFESFFTTLYGSYPFPWQKRLAERVCSGRWPACIALPTASGKTACIDLAVFALACQAGLGEKRTAARRIFFVVDRRVIVDEAFRRAEELAARLQQAQSGVLKKVADRLRTLAGDETGKPLSCHELRGGVFRDSTFIASPLQPAIICSTVDQIGSRLLFRGYGVSPCSAPIHAALVAHDSLIILDEAHCAEPFRQTLAAVERYRGKQWCQKGQHLHTPFTFVELSATPRSNEKPFTLNQEDRRNKILAARLAAQKPMLLEKGQHGTATRGFADDLVKAAQTLEASGARRIAIIVNRVATARLVHTAIVKRIRNESAPLDVALMMGRMRPMDRDRLLKTWSPRLCAARDRPDVERPVYVVATQCLEVGANLDFDAMVSECAGLDALRQRCGRLLRLGRSENDVRNHVGVIVGPADGTKDGTDDPVYGPALAKTWNWLGKHARPVRLQAEAGLGPRPKGKAASGDALVIDMGINAVDGLLPPDGSTRRQLLAELSASAPNAPIMLPAHIDCWVQTTPVPTPDPDVTLFLHGPQRGEPSVSVCWRADLDLADASASIEAVSLCPPSSSECMPVPIGAFRKWLAGQLPISDSGDAEGGRVDQEESDKGAVVETKRVLRWRGSEDASVIADPGDVRAGDVFVVPAQDQGWNELGHVPPGSQIDLGDCANLAIRHKAVLRLCPALIQSWPNVPAREDIRTWVQDFDPDTADESTWDGLRDHLRALGDQIASSQNAADWGWLSALASVLSNAAGIDRSATVHPIEGMLLRRPRKLDAKELRFLGVADADAEDTDEDEGDSHSFGRSMPVTLADHTRHVVDSAVRLAKAADLPGEVCRAIERAAFLHDLGKLDARWQAWVRGVPRWMPMNGNAPLAKGGGTAPSSVTRARRRARAALPDGFRHEFLSLQLAEHLDGLPGPCDPVQRDLILFLVGTHHGFGRPFAPVAADDNPPGVEAAGLLPSIGGIKPINWCAEERRAAAPPHRLDSGVPERFWRCVRRYGWWGAAYIEAVFRLSDWIASARESGKE